MTNQQGAPEALRLADALASNYFDGKHGRNVWDAAAAELRHLHAENKRLAALVEAQQPAPSAAAAVGNSGFDYQTAADVLNGKTVSDEVIRKFVAASRWAHDDRVGLRATLLSVRGELASREAEIALLKKALMDAEAPQPPPTPQADSQPALDNLRALFREALAWGMTYGPEIPSHQWDEMRESMVEQYASRAARAPADSVTAPAGGVVGAPIYRIRTKNTKNVVWTTVPKHEYLAALEAPEIFECELISTPPAQAADSVLEDADPLQGAANWLAEAHGQFGVSVLQGCLMIGYNRAKRLHDAAIAAREQGGAT